MKKQSLHSIHSINSYQTKQMIFFILPNFSFHFPSNQT